jgi:hypothetical protein
LGGMALEFGLVWGQVTLRTSLGDAYVDQEQYPEIELDGRERVVLPGVHEILIANGEVELRIKDCNRAELRYYTIQHVLKPGQTSLISEQGDLQLELKQLSAGNWRIDQISLHLPLHLQMHAVKELNKPSIDFERVAPATHMGRKAVPGQFFQIGPDFLRETIRSDSMLKRRGCPPAARGALAPAARHSSPRALQSKAWGDLGPAVQPCSRTETRGIHPGPVAQIADPELWCHHEHLPTLTVSVLVLCPPCTVPTQA